MEFRVFILVLIAAYGSAFIVPNEIPTVLSLVYSNIPPLKIGVDTRLGLGFRLGPHADFQTILEIGPQLDTKKLVPVGDDPAKRELPPFQPLRPQEEFQPLSPARSQEEYQNLRIPIKAEEEPVQEETPEKKRIPPKKTPPLFGKIVFKKVPGIDD